MRKVVSLILSAVIAVAALAVPASAELVESTGKIVYVKANKSYTYTVDEKCTPITFVLSTDTEASVYTEMSATGTGQLTRTIATTSYHDTVAMSTATLGINYKTAYAELLAEYDTTGEIKSYMPTYYDFLTKDAVALSDEAYSTFYKMWYELPPTEQNVTYNVAASTPVRITYKGDTPGDSFKFKFNTSDKLTQHEVLGPTTPYVTLKKGATLSIYQKSAKYSTSNKKVATVSAKGIITAKGAGTCYITAKLNGKNYIYPIRVYTKSYTKGSINSNVMSIEKFPSDYTVLKPSTATSLSDTEIDTEKYFKFTLLRPTTVTFDITIDGSANNGYVEDGYWGVLSCATLKSFELTDGKNVLYKEDGNTEEYQEFLKNVFSSSEKFTHTYEYSLNAGTYYIKTNVESLNLGPKAVQLTMKPETGYYMFDNRVPVINLKKGKTFNLNGEGAMFSLRYSTTNKKVATVTNSGKVTAKGAGTCTISTYIDGVRYMYKLVVTE